MPMLIVVVCVLAGVISTTSKDVDSIIKERNDLLQKEIDMMLGSDIMLSDSEQKANEIIMNLKNQEMDYAFHRPQHFNISKHFFDYKDDVKNSPLFKLIQRMPKGAILHAHDTAILGSDYILRITYLDKLYVCFVNDEVHFLFSDDFPEIPCGTVWQLMRDVRYSSVNVEKFDEKLKRHFTLIVDNPHQVYTDINTVWEKFQQFFITTSPLFTYKPVWEQYFYDSLKALREDNIMYIEVRSVLPRLYDLDGTTFDPIVTAEVYFNVTKKFMADYPDFFGAKLIYAPLRRVNVKTVEEYIETAKKLKERFPDFLAGFDMVGQEDLGMPTKEFLPILLEASHEFDYFFHAGETNWYGTTSDENIADAIVLGARRIGHAFAISKHPLLIEEVKRRDIALEINVVSNSVLTLVKDIRNHPMSSFLAQGLPVIVSSDDPGCWDAEPLSHDFYVTFVAVASRHADLRLLKKLAINSLYYSAASNKDKLVYEFEVRWTSFIDSVVKDKW